jgi:DNA primase
VVKSLPFPAIKAAVTIEQVAEFSGIKWKRESTTLRAACPVHGGHERSLTVTPKKKDDKGDDGVYFCSASKEGGDRIALYAHIKGIKQYKAHLDIAQAFAPHLIDGEPHKEVPTVPEEPEKVQKKEEGSSPERGFRELPYLDPHHPSVQALGFPPEIAVALGLGYAPRGHHKQRVAVPMRLADGRLVGYISLEGGVLLPPKWQL